MKKMAIKIGMMIVISIVAIMIASGFETRRVKWNYFPHHYQVAVYEREPFGTWELVNVDSEWYSEADREAAYEMYIGEEADY